MTECLLFVLCFLFISSAAYAQYTPGGLYSLARAGDLAGVKAIVEKGVDQDRLNNALGAATVSQQLDIMTYLIDRGADSNHISSWQTRLLTNAIMNDYLDAATLLIKRGADVNIRGYRRYIKDLYVEWDWTPLMCAAYKGNLPLVKLVLSKGAALDAVGWSQTIQDQETATDIAAYSGHTAVMKYLYGKGGTLSTETIFKAIRGGHRDIVDFLLKRGSDIDRVSEFSGKTLLMEACWWGQRDIVALLLSRGADVDQSDADGSTPLLEAIKNAGPEFPNQADIVTLLLKHHADVNKADKYGITPLMRAIKKNLTPIIDMLVKKGAK